MICVGCGADVADIEYPVHGDMRTSPGCWALFCDVLGREFSNRAYWPVHQLTVNAYALQHAASNPALHLLALCLRFEHGYLDDRILPVMRRAVKEKSSLPFVEAPAASSKLTVLSVYAAKTAEEHIASVERWAKAVWASYGDSHDVVRRFAQHLMTPLFRTDPAL